MEHSPPSLSVKILLSLLLGVLGTISLCGCRSGNKAEPFKHKAAASPLESPVFELVERSKVEDLMKKEKLENSESKFLFSFLNILLFMKDKGI